MKPDKHKQKRTQQYKKKHGMKDDKDTKTENPPQKSHGNSQRTENETKTAGGHASTVQGATAGAGSIGHQRGDARHDTNSKLDSQAHGSPSYRRRQVLSNWERYAEIDDEPEEIHTERRGADFKTLLDTTSSAASQFRLADERFLDEEVTSTSTADLHSLLTIDMNQLAAALECVPLHTKLNIGEEAFTKEDIELFEQHASENRKLYIKNRETQLHRNEASKEMENLSKIWENDSDILHFLNPPENIIRDENSSVEDSNLKASSRTENKLNTFAPSAQHIEEELDKLLESPKDIHDSSVNSERDQEQSVEIAETRDDETVEDQMLDEVLKHGEISPKNLSHETSKLSDVHTKEMSHNAKPSFNDHSPVATITGQVLSKMETSVKAPVKNLEDDLDALLSLDNDSPSQTTTRKVNNVTKDESKNDDLEDWLDSVLDE